MINKARVNELTLYVQDHKIPKYILHFYNLDTIQSKFIKFLCTFSDLENWTYLKSSENRDGGQSWKKSYYPGPPLLILKTHKHVVNDYQSPRGCFIRITRSHYPCHRIIHVLLLIGLTKWKVVYHLSILYPIYKQYK